MVLAHYSTAYLAIPLLAIAAVIMSGSTVVVPAGAAGSQGVALPCPARGVEQ